MLRLLRNRKTRGWILQIALLAVTLALLVVIVVTARQNLLDQGIATGFDFLERSTGWPINFSLIDVSDRSPYWRMLLAGLLNTLYVGLMGLAGASIFGLAVGLARISSNLVLNILGAVFVETFRNVPLILQIVFWYAVLLRMPPPRGAIDLLGIGFLTNRGLVLPALTLSPLDLAVLAAAVAAAIVLVRRASARLGGKAWALAGLGLIVLFMALLYAGRAPDTPILTLPELQGLRFIGGTTVKPEFAALLIGMLGFGGAYIGEIFRGGFLAVDQGRIEAAHALGLSGFHVNRFVRIPLALRAMLPALTNQYVWLMKATTLGVAVGYPDFFMVVSTSINQAGQAIELLLILMGGFLAINYAIGGVMNAINARLAIKGRS